MTRVRTGLLGTALCLVTACAARGSVTPDLTITPIVVELRPDRNWDDTGVTVRNGDRLFITATGSVFWADRRAQLGPDGLAGYPGWKVGAGGLVGRVGQKTFDIGARTQPFLSKYLRIHTYSAPPPIRMPSDGRLLLGFKEFQPGANTGEFQVTIRPVR